MIIGRSSIIDDLCYRATHHLCRMWTGMAFLILIPPVFIMTSWFDPWFSFVCIIDLHRSATVEGVECSASHPQRLEGLSFGDQGPLLIPRLTCPDLRPGADSGCLILQRFSPIGRTLVKPASLCEFMHCLFHF